MILASLVAAAGSGAVAGMKQRQEYVKACHAMGVEPQPMPEPIKWAEPKPDPYRYPSPWLALALVFGLSGCASVEKTLGAVDYSCFDVEVNPHGSDSGILGRGIVLPEGETLTAETVQMLCEY